MHVASVGFMQGTWCHWQKSLCPAVPPDIIHYISLDIISLITSHTQYVEKLVHIHYCFETSFILIENVVTILVLLYICFI